MSESLKSHILNNRHWWTKQFTFDHLQSSVTRVHFVAHENPLNEAGSPGESPTNHWTLYFFISDDLYVHIDAVPSDPGSPGTILIESKNSAPATDGCIHMVTADVRVGLTVEDLLGVIVNNKRDNYTFDPATGEGCRYWLSVISKDFVQAGIIHKHESDTVINALGMYWPSPLGTPPVPRPVARGSFNA